jgi:hypothetical protein
LGIVSPEIAAHASRIPATLEALAGALAAEGRAVEAA